MRIRFVSPWYPDYARPHSGIFVAKQVAAVRELGLEVVVDVAEIFPAPPGPIPKAVTDAIRALARKSPEAMFQSEGGVTHVPTPVPSRSGPLGRARATAEALTLIGEFRNDAHDLIHAHLGIPTAWAVAHTHPDLPLVVTEHQSTLAAVFSEPPAARAYAGVVRKADAFICVSGHLRDQIAENVGDWARDRIQVVPNIVDLTEIPFRERPSLDFSSWIYVGGLMVHKGVQSLLKSFFFYQDRYDDQARLTLVGDGPLTTWIKEFAVDHEISESVRLVGSVTHHHLGSYLSDADVMVHLSPAETFGIAPLEGIGSGLPVVCLRNPGAVNTWGDLEDQCGLMLSLEATPPEIAEAISELRDSASRLQPAAGREAILTRYSRAVVAEQLVSIYEQVLH